jgi:TolA-binding protein
MFIMLLGVMSETVAKVMNQLGNTCSRIANENRELRQQVSLLNARVESLNQFIRECIPNVIVQSQEKSFKKLSKCMSLFNLPDSPLQQNTMTMTNQFALPPPPMMLSNTNTATMVSTLSSAPPSVATASASGAVTDNTSGNDVGTAKRPFDGVAVAASQSEHKPWMRTIQLEKTLY